ncbi:ABC transporter ATP-binding protein [Spiroplasma helicoides]|uniref:ABC transporter ATP-binding protein n=1 Tax=Spiroplasma helicoides TaxID=216938 RepID=A0A1B3SKH5_9MOLU|nr:ABC transporter ATP-binding protein [Spiroplasma helicoides]AOG60434.1 ABC transporter ATP-binding protein [Spiroplasma helicoides]
MIKIENLSKMFDDISGVKNITYNFEKGFYGLLGKNGSGKSTLLKLISGITFYNDGKIIINDLNNKENNFNLERIALVSGDKDLPETIKVFEVFKLARFINKDRKDDFDKISDLLDIDIHSKKYIKELSTGMYQKIKLCLAFGYQRDIYLLDEITLGLDPISCEDIISFIKNNLQDKLIIFSSHKLEEIRDLCNEVIVLNNNRIEKVFKVKDSQVFEKYAELYK